MAKGAVFYAALIALAGLISATTAAQSARRGGRFISAERCLDEPRLRGALDGLQGYTHAPNAAALDVVIAKVRQFGCDRQGRSTVALVDFGRRSSQPRLWLIDLKTGAGLAQPMLVAHGKGSDPDDDGQAEVFSNTNGSLMSSLGLFRVAEPYWGKNGLSLKVDGMEASNSLARKRDLAVHTTVRVPPHYVSLEYLTKYGKLGLSDGCFVVLLDDFEHIYQTLQSGGWLIAVGPEPALPPAPVAPINSGSGPA